MACLGVGASSSMGITWRRGEQWSDYTVDTILIHSSWIHQAIFFITVSNSVSSAWVKMFEMLAILVGYNNILDVCNSPEKCQVAHGPTPNRGRTTLTNSRAEGVMQWRSRDALTSQNTQSLQQAACTTSSRWWRGPTPWDDRWRLRQ